MNNSKYEQYLSRLGCCYHRFPDSSNYFSQEIISPSIKRRTKVITIYIHSTFLDKYFLYFILLIYFKQYYRNICKINIFLIISFFDT